MSSETPPTEEPISELEGDKSSVTQVQLPPLPSTFIPRPALFSRLESILIPKDDYPVPDEPAESEGEVTTLPKKAENKSTFLFVSGPSGIGKTCLVSWCLQSLIDKEEEVSKNRIEIEFCSVGNVSSSGAIGALVGRVKTLILSHSECDKLILWLDDVWVSKQMDELLKMWKEVMLDECSISIQFVISCRLTQVSELKQSVCSFFGEGDFLSELIVGELTQSEALRLFMKHIGLSSVEQLDPCSVEIVTLANCHPLCVSLLGTALKRLEDRIWGRIVKQLQSIVSGGGSILEWALRRVLEMRLGRVRGLSKFFLSLCVFCASGWKRRVPIHVLQRYWGLRSRGKTEEIVRMIEARAIGIQLVEEDRLVRVKSRETLQSKGLKTFELVKASTIRIHDAVADFVVHRALETAPTGEVETEGEESEKKKTLLAHCQQILCDRITENCEVGEDSVTILWHTYCEAEDASFVDDDSAPRDLYVRRGVKYVLGHLALLLPSSEVESNLVGSFSWLERRLRIVQNKHKILRDFDAIPELGPKSKLIRKALLPSLFAMSVSTSKNELAFQMKARLLGHLGVLPRFLAQLISTMKFRHHFVANEYLSPLNCIEEEKLVLRHPLQAKVSGLVPIRSGTALVSSSSKPEILVWNLADSRVEKVIQGNTSGVAALGVLEFDDSGIVVTGGYDRTVRLFDLASGEEFWHRDCEQSHYAWRIATDAAHRQFAVYYRGKEITVYTISLEREVEVRSEVAITNISTHHLSFSLDGRFLYTGSPIDEERNQIAAASLYSCYRLAIVDIENSTVEYLEDSENPGGIVRIWNIKDRKFRRIPCSAGASVAFDGVRKEILIGGSVFHKTIKFYPMEEPYGELADRVIKEHSRDVTALHVCQDTQRVFAGGGDASIRVFPIGGADRYRGTLLFEEGVAIADARLIREDEVLLQRRGKELAVYRPSLDSENVFCRRDFKCFTYVVGNRIFVAVMRNSDLQVVSLPDQTILRTLETDYSIDVNSDIVITPKKEVVLVPAKDHVVVYDPATDSVYQMTERLDGLVAAMRLNPCDPEVVVFSLHHKSTFFAWNYVSDQMILRISLPPTNWIRGFEFLKNGKEIVTYGFTPDLVDTMVHVYSYPDGEEERAFWVQPSASVLAKMDESRIYILSLKTLTDGRTAVILSMWNEVQCVDLLTGRTLGYASGGEVHPLDFGNFFLIVQADEDSGKVFNLDFPGRTIALYRCTPRSALRPVCTATWDHEIGYISFKTFQQGRVGVLAMMKNAGVTMATIQFPMKTRPEAASVPAWSSDPPKAKKMAFIVGNCNYLLTSPLFNASNDARDLEKVLTQLGFEVTCLIDTTRDQFEEALDDFCERRSDVSGNTFALFFYSGHGLSYEGVNYILPIDYDGRIEHLEDDGIDLDLIVNTVVDADSSGVNVFVFDCCRDFPVTALRGGEASLEGKGCVQLVERSIRSRSQIALVFSTQYGNTSLDGQGRNSYFTSALLESLLNPRLSLDRVLANVKTQVARVTSQQQIPEYFSNIDIIHLHPGHSEEDIGDLKQQLIEQRETIASLLQTVEFLKEQNERIRGEEEEE